MGSGHTSRRTFATSLWALAGLTVGSASLQARGQAPSAAPPRYPKDAWLDAIPGKHRTFIDTSTVNGGGTGLLYAYNIFAANKADYGLSDSDVAIIVCFRHASVSFGFDDAIWEKYGRTIHKTVQQVDPKTKEIPKTNLYLSADYGTDLPNYGVTIRELAGKGAHFAICANATRGLAERISADSGQPVDGLLKELLAHTIPNSHVVTAGVLAVNRAQEHGYTLLTAV